MRNISFDAARRARLSRTDRRKVLKGLGATALGLAVSRARAQPGPHVAIVGAGMAGLAAARVFTRHRVPFTLIDARDRIGGRAFTDWKTLNAPFDQGAAYLHVPKSNPLTALAEEHGLPVSQTALHPLVFFAGENQGARGIKAFDTAYGELAHAIGTTGAHGDDIAAAGLVNARTVWDRMAAFALGPEHTGVGLNQLSTLDWYSQLAIGANREGAMRDGVGNFVTAFGAGLPVSLSTPVTRVDWRGPGVKIETTTGTIDADYCIVTVPIGVLRDGGIGFVPALPPAKQTAIAGIGAGVVNKIALAFRPNALPPEKDVWLYQLRKDGTIADVVVRPFGYDMTVHTTGGDFAREVELLNKADQITFALATIGEIFGNDIAAGCTGGGVTRWSRDPYSAGSYSVALPGQAKQRAELARPVGERLYFAGEAAAPSWASSLAGALISGRAAARIIAEKLGAKIPESTVHIP